jgi:hypothetical protein
MKANAVYATGTPSGTTQEWTSENSAQAANIAGAYVTPGTDPGNHPGGRHSGMIWTDSTGHLWMFGGNGYDSAGNAGNLNDLWKF